MYKSQILNIGSSRNETAIPLNFFSRRPGKSKDKQVIKIVLILVFLTGISMIIYSPVSRYFTSLSHVRIISQFNRNVAQLSDADCGGIIAAANEYNESLATNPRRFQPGESGYEKYRQILDFTGTGVIGSIDIAAINVKLPIYLGADEKVLQRGAGHLEGSSLPVGGPNTHSIICAHRGLPNSTLFADADRLVIGDTFTLKILNETLTYKIDNIAVVEPEDYKYLQIEQGKDYCTLVTCTPIGTNINRLLIRGSRILP